MKRLEIAFVLLRIPLDFLMAILAFSLAYRLRFITGLIPGIALPFDPLSLPPFEQYLNFSLLATLVLMAIFAFNKMYSFQTNLSRSKEIGKIIMATSAWLMLMIVYFFSIRSFPFSRLTIVYTWILSIVFISSGRFFIGLLHSLLLLAGIGKKNLVFLGNNELTAQLWKNLISTRRYACVGVIDDPQNAEKTDLKFLGHMDDFIHILKKNAVDEVIQAKTDLPKQQGADIFEYCRQQHIQFSFVPDLLELQQTNIEMKTIGGIPVITLKPTPLGGWGRILKRIFDIVGSFFGIIILSPLFLIIAILIKIDSKGTVFFKYLDDGSRVKRVGQYGKLFHFYKFRTMYPNTHNLRYTTLAEHNTREGTPLVKIKNDPRVTRVGKFLRKTSLDELPQLFNVLKGQMSLVGPRPHLPEEVEKYQQHHHFVLTMKPGITGLPQISGRSDLNFEEEVRLDTYYIEHWSLWLDLKIILKTFGAILKGYKE